MKSKLNILRYDKDNSVEGSLTLCEYLVDIRRQLNNSIRTRIKQARDLNNQIRRETCRLKIHKLFVDLEETHGIIRMTLDVRKNEYSRLEKAREDYRARLMNSLNK